MLFTPLRFPGQYFDEETGLHENWNRFYSPNDFRYLQIEPVVREPALIEVLARYGRHVPLYAYAANNPVGLIDATGLLFGPRLNATQDASFARLAAHPVIGPKIRAMGAAQDVYVWFSPEQPVNGSESVLEPVSFVTKFLEEGGRYHGRTVNQCSVAIKINLDRDRVRAAYIFPQLVFTYDESLAHELGHMYRDWMNWRGTSGWQNSGVTAREWENAVRQSLGHGYRPPDPGHP